MFFLLSRLCKNMTRIRYVGGLNDNDPHRVLGNVTIRMCGLATVVVCRVSFFFPYSLGLPPPSSQINKMRLILIYECSALAWILSSQSS